MYHQKKSINHDIFYRCKFICIFWHISGSFDLQNLFNVNRGCVFCCLNVTICILYQFHGKYFEWLHLNFPINVHVVRESAKIKKKIIFFVLLTFRKYTIVLATDEFQGCWKSKNLIHDVETLINYYFVRYY